MSANWIDEFEDEQLRRIDAEDARKAMAAADQRSRDLDRASTTAQQRTEARYSEVLNATYFDEALKGVLRSMLRERVLEMRKRSRDYLRDYTDAEIEAWVQTPDERGDTMALVARVTGPELIRDMVVNVVRVTLPSQSYVFHVCPRTGEVMR